VALVTGITVMAGGRAVDRIGPRAPILTGTCLMSVSTAAMVLWTPSTPDAVLILSLAVQAMGNGLLMGTAAVYSISALRTHELSQGATVRQVVQQLGSTLSAAVLAVILAARLQGGSGPEHAQAAYDTVNIVVTVLLGIGIVAAWRIPRGVVRPEDAP
jgi:MFS family permease